MFSTPPVPLQEKRSAGIITQNYSPSPGGFNGGVFAQWKIFSSNSHYNKSMTDWVIKANCCVSSESPYYPFGPASAVMFRSGQHCLLWHWRESVSAKWLAVVMELSAPAWKETSAKQKQAGERSTHDRWEEVIKHQRDKPKQTRHGGAYVSTCKLNIGGYTHIH